MDLSESQMQIARLLGITEAAANKLRDGIKPKVGYVLNNLNYVSIYHALFLKNFSL